MNKIFVGKISYAWFFFLLILSLFFTGCRPDETDKSEEQSTAIQNVGSDTIVNLALAWAEAYAELFPEIRISVTGGGS
ncbi:MAG: hypothetical protein JXA42_19845, partial [Anaerolineales bacterium]|nr:hypothetical protein [Anaerolineales bacterium]